MVQRNRLSTWGYQGRSGVHVWFEIPNSTESTRTSHTSHRILRTLRTGPAFCTKTGSSSCRLRGGTRASGFTDGEFSCKMPCYQQSEPLLVHGGARLLAHAPSAARCNHGLAVLETTARLVCPNLSAAQFGGLHAVPQPYGLGERSVGWVLVKWPHLSSLDTETVRELGMAGG